MSNDQGATSNRRTTSTLRLVNEFISEALKNANAVISK